MTIDALEREFLKDNGERLSSISYVIDALDTSDLNLGDSILKKFLTAVVTDNTQVGSSVVVQVIKATKRSALLDIGGLCYRFNKYGVARCLIPSNIGVEALSVIWGPSLPAMLKERVFRSGGVTSEPDTKYLGERIFNYSGLKETQRFECLANKMS